jgi:hypothetical protein
MSVATNYAEAGREVQQIWCVGTKPDGEACGARAMRGSDFCYWHDPAMEEERLSGFVRYPRGAGTPILSEAGQLDSLEDLQALLRRVAIQVVTGQRVETRRVTALNGLAAQLTRVIKIRELQSQLKEAEEEIVDLRHRCEGFERMAKEAWELQSQLKAAEAEIGQLRQRCEEYERMLEEALGLQSRSPTGAEAAAVPTSSAGAGGAEERGD